ncbi:testis-specific serine/threonine-protein kinase 6 [Eucyclogobius newberryi]|uniref:testis-specific serine/threonine-protein kinase 6 n=1 Tax=Eucyclogobius newberryi TaxID=166745 RepID=UPI003B5C47BB
MSLGAKDKLFMEKNGLTFQRSLGEGRYGKVVKAYSCRTRQNYAVKIIDAKTVEKSYLSKFLSRELEIIKCLKHPNVIKTYNVFEQSSSKVFVVMELCVNGNLSEYMKTEGPLSEERSRQLLVQLCAAIQYLHSISVAHRDLKCENLLLDRKNQLKVCDFGMSKRLTYTDGQLDLSHTFCGTNAYAPPEILRSMPYNPAVADVWSMGVILYEMLYNILPFFSMNVTKMVRLQLRHSINFPDSPHVSPPAVALILSMLHPDTEHRIQVDSILQSRWMTEGTEESPLSAVEPGQKTGEDADDVAKLLSDRQCDC